VLSGIAVPSAIAHDSAAGTAAATITIRSGLSDRDVRVGVGDIVRFVNRDDDRHRMRSRSGPRAFDTGNIEPGESSQVRLTVAGTYSYLDERNDELSAYRGRIVVGSGDGSGSGSVGSTAAAGGSTAGGSTAAGSVPSSATLTIGDDYYQPTSFRIAVGGSVTFRNSGGDEHSATSNAFDTGAMRGGSSVRKTFETAGTFDFLCMFHSDMRGTIKVVAAGAGGSAPAQAPKSDPTPVATPAPVVTGQTGTAPTTASVDIADFSFGPATIDVAAGGSVEWTNAGIAPHTVTAKDESFKSGMLETGSTFRQTFATPGTYEYVCAVHPDMAGTVQVVATGGAAAGSAPVAALAPPTGEPAAPDQAAPAAATDVSALAGIVLTITLVSAAAALFSKVIRGTVRIPE
jgi:plastocyanin